MVHVWQRDGQLPEFINYHKYYLFLPCVLTLTHFFENIIYIDGHTFIILSLIFLEFKIVKMISKGI